MVKGKAKEGKKDRTQTSVESGTTGSCCTAAATGAGRSAGAGISKRGGLSGAGSTGGAEGGAGEEADGNSGIGSCFGTETSSSSG